MTNPHHEFNYSAEREQAQEKIEQVTRRTKLAPYIATFGIASAAFYGAIDNHDSLTSIALGAGVVASAGLIAERKYAERQVDKAVDTYKSSQQLFGDYVRTEVSIDKNGELVESDEFDIVAFGHEYRGERSVIAGSLLPSLGAPLTGYLEGRIISGNVLPGSELPIHTVASAIAGMGIIGLTTAHRSANKLHDSAVARLDNLDGGLSFTDTSE